jgi:hypothetical protein
VSVLGSPQLLLKRSDARPARRGLRRLGSPTGVGLARVLIGATILAKPDQLAKTHGVDPETGAQLGWAVQMLGARDVALGVGTVLAARTRDAGAVRRWLVAGLIADSADALAIGFAAGRGRVALGPAAVSVATATASVAFQVAELAERPRRRFR